VFKSVKIAVTGATGQMGSEVIKEAKKADIDIETAVDSNDDKVNGLEVVDDKHLIEELEESDTDAIIDFTAPKATLKYLEAARKTDTCLVIGTTGFTEEQEQEIKETALHVPVLKESNFSPAISAMKDLVQEASEKLDGYDVEITETHHNNKEDAPSGTAKSLLENIKETKQEATGVHGREGMSVRQDDEIGIHARRSGSIRGSHEVLLAGNDEVLKLRHRSESRKVFASGALEAAKWLQNKPPGMYKFEQVLDG
jgi:4-hydroxy-tetrahydrodipicolinate reductase